MTDREIYVESCTSHVYVEWNFIADVSKSKYSHSYASPTFNIGNRRYFLRSLVDIRCQCFNFLLSSEKPLEKSIRVWAGLKCPGGNYVHGIGKLWPRDELDELLRIYDLDCLLSCFGDPRDSCSFTLCFQAQVEEESDGTESCTHDYVERMLTPNDGQIYKKDCSCLKHIEWTVDFDWIRQNWASPVFETGSQLFRFLFTWDSSEECLELKLYWLGPSSFFPPLSARYWTGLKRCDGTYHHKNETGLFVMAAPWNPQLNLMRVMPEEISNYHLDRNNRLTFFLRINEETGAESCNFDRPEEFPRGVGSIQIQLLSPYLLVEWTFAIDQISYVSSPIFVIDNQNYVLSFERGPDFDAECSLSRKGPAADRNMRYLWTVWRSDDLYEDLGCGHGLLPLKMTADLWFDETIICLLKPSETCKQFTVNLLLVYVESPDAETLWFSTVSEVEEDFIDSPEMDPSSFVVFKVEDKAFKIHRSPVLICVPVFKRMLSSDCVEARTGVVNIEDCEARVFKEFLELVETGYEKNPSEENVGALYHVANKYLLRGLKDKCRMRIEENLSVDNICDVLELGFVYEDEDLLNSASGFLSRNTDIMESGSFCDVCCRYPTLLRN